MSAVSQPSRDLPTSLPSAPTARTGSVHAAPINVRPAVVNVRPHTAAPFSAQPGEHATRLSDEAREHLLKHSADVALRKLQEERKAEEERKEREMLEKKEQRAQREAVCLPAFFFSRVFEFIFVMDTQRLKELQNEARQIAARSAQQKKKKNTDEHEDEGMQCFFVTPISHNSVMLQSQSLSSSISLIK